MDVQKNSLAYWTPRFRDIRYEDIRYDDWLTAFDDLIASCRFPVIDLGCGSGNNTKYLTEKGKRVTACDLTETAVESIRRNFPGVETRCFDMTDGLPFADDSADLMIADLSLHYFTEKDTNGILREIRRVLTAEGHLLFRVNSTGDVNHGAGQGRKAEPRLYLTKDGRYKRFFTEDDVRLVFRDFSIQYLKEESMYRYGEEKRLYRCCAQNKK